MNQLSEPPMIDTETRDYRDPLGWVRPFTCMFSSVAIAVMAVVWDFAVL